MTNLSIDGELFRFVPDTTRDIVDIYNTPQESGIQSISEPTELGESLKELNNDDIDKATRMSGIDMRSRLHFMEISSILAVDTLVAFSFLPQECIAFTRQKKRLNVSRDGKGREEVVSIVQGKREGDQQVGTGSLADRIGGFFKK